MGNNHSIILESATMVSKVGSNVCLPTSEIAKESLPAQRRTARTMDKSKMGHLCLENTWSHESSLAGWSKRASSQLPLCLAPSTLLAYNRVIEKFDNFCSERYIDFPPAETAVVADFLCVLADASESPKSVLKTAQAALNHVYKSCGSTHDNPMDSVYIHMLISALVKSTTFKLLNKSSVMPVKPFAELFKKWPVNEQLSINDLRLKVICLMALTLMLRPSDIAPKSVHFKSKTFELSKWLFTTDNVHFLESGSVKIIFHGIKNDTSRSGFEVEMQPTADPQLNPVLALQVYIARTEKFRSVDKPVFLSLLPPYGPISASCVGGIMNESIKLAGLSDQGYSAKSFRPTGPTIAIKLAVTQK